MSKPKPTDKLNLGDVICHPIIDRGGNMWSDTGALVDRDIISMLSKLEIHQVVIAETPQERAAALSGKYIQFPDMEGIREDAHSDTETFGA